MNAQDRRLSDEAAAWRRRYRDAREVLDEQNIMMLGLWLRERLADPSDFEALIGIETVREPSGRINWVRLDALVDELLAVKPHLAAENPWRRGSRALDFFSTGT